MSIIPGTNVSAPIVPNDSLDIFPTHDSVYGIGGWREVADTTTRDAIPSQRLRQGMIVFVIADSTAYLYNGSGWDVFVANTFQPIMFSSWLPGKPLSGAIILKVKVAVAFSIPSNLAGSQVSVGTAGGGTYSIQKNGSQFGTMTGGAFSGSATSFVIGDILSIVAPAPQDATLANVAMTIYGTR